MMPSSRLWPGCLPGLVVLACAVPALAARPTSGPAARPAPARSAVAPVAREYGPPPPPSPHALCEDAIAEAGKDVGKTLKMPANLPLSIARVESGRADAATGRARPWPWTINAGGVGSFYATKAEAVAAAQALRARGVQSFDVGCMQVNLRYHPQAFADLEEAFDPRVNARYAIRFLMALHRQTGNWVQATAYYHSQTQDLGEEYARKVLGPAAVPVGAVAGLPGKAGAGSVGAEPSGPYASWPPPGMAFAAFPPANYAFGAFAQQGAGTQSAGAQSAGAKPSTRTKTAMLAVPGLTVPGKGLPGVGGASFLALSGQPLQLAATPATPPRKRR